MPRFVLEVEVVSAPQFATALTLTYQRFPEIAVEYRDVPRPRESIAERAKEIWVCRAPSEAHLGRWAAASQLRIAIVSAVGDKRCSHRRCLG